MSRFYAVLSVLVILIAALLSPLILTLHNAPGGNRDEPKARQLSATETSLTMTRALRVRFHGEMPEVEVALSAKRQINRESPCDWDSTARPLAVHFPRGIHDFDRSPAAIRV